LEYTLFVAVRDRIATQAGLLQRIAAAVAQLDTLAALAEAAVLYNYVRPCVDTGSCIVVSGASSGGRAPARWLCTE